MIDSRRIVHLALVALLSALGACTQGVTSSGPPGTVTIDVTAEGQPVAGVSASIAGPTDASGTTNASGELVFPSVRPGSYSVQISGWPSDVQFSTSSRDTFVGEKQNLTVAFEGTFVRTAAIHGTVTVTGGGAGGMTVTLDGPDPSQTTTASDGSFAFQGIRSGDYTVQIADPAGHVVWDHASHTVSLAVGQTADVTFTGDFLIAATVNILGLRKASATLSVDPAHVQGTVDVKLHVDPGSETVSRVRILVGGALLATQDFGTGGLTTAQDVTVPINTVEYDMSTGGPLVSNGPQVLKAAVDTEGRGADAATATLDVTLDNADAIVVEGPQQDGSVVRGGHRWYGNRDLVFQVVPVLYSGRAISSVTLQATGDPSAYGGPSLDLGSGPGQPHTVTGQAPFVFTAARANNEGSVEDATGGAGHTIEVVKVLDGSGADVTSQVASGSGATLDGVYMDFMPPQVRTPGADGDVLVGTTSPDGSKYFSSGSFALAGLADGGVGGDHMVTWDVLQNSNPKYQDVTGVSDLNERSAPDYRLSVRSVADELGNAVDLAATPVAGDDQSAGFGVDRGAPTPGSVFPAADGTLHVFNVAGGEVRFTATDAPLSDGSAGAGADLSGVSAAVVNNGGGAASGWSLSHAAANFTLDLTGLAQGAYDVSAGIPDLASPANSTSLSWKVAMDGTAPTLQFTEVPSDAQAQAGSSTLQLKLGGTISDNFGVSSTQSKVEVRYDSNNTPVASASCGPYGSGALYAAPAEIDRNSVQIGSTFLESFTAQNPNPGGATVVYRYCIWATAADAATNALGAPNPNKTQSYVQVDVTWNP